MQALIRYNTNYPARSDKKWRVLIGEVQHLVDEVEIICKSYTSEDTVIGDDGNKVTKYHIACKPKQITFTNKKVLKAILR
jgi:hypothetical protein